MTPKQWTILMAVSSTGLLMSIGVCGHQGLIGVRTDELATLRQEYSSLNQNIRDQRCALDFDTMRDLITRFQGSPSIELDVADILHKVATDLELLGVREASITNGTAGNTGSLQYIPLELSFRTTLANVFELVNRLGEYDHVIRVHRLSIARDPSGSADALAVTVLLESFALAPEEVH